MKVVAFSVKHTHTFQSKVDKGNPNKVIFLDAWLITTISTLNLLRIIIVEGIILIKT